ncbi:PucR family transcriptional regulator [Agrococcus sp. TSP3-2-1]|uniref:PucR family transcriptional regulator n=1 Tax=Agrococcus sp. TSP3-2-1 TaxID=2804583 RepID=UPI003CEA7820
MAAATASARIAVADVLAWDDLELRLVGRAAGLDRDVRWALTTELLDPSPYLQGGELVLTTGMSLRSPRDCAAFVGAIAGTRPAAIGFAIGAGADEVPDALVAAANRSGLAVLAVPPSVAFVSITERIAIERARFDARASERQAAGALIDAVRRGLASGAVLLPLLHRVGGDEWSVVVTGVSRVSEPAGAAVVGTIDDLAVAIVRPYDLEATLGAAGGASGWSGPVDVRGLAGAIREAVVAHRLGLRSGVTTGPRQLASWDGLLQRLTDEQLAPFRAHVLEPLVAYDRRAHARLVDTVEAFLAHDASVQESAAALFVHANTVRKRLARVHAVVGLDALDGRDRTTLAIALACRR